ncbi:MAG: hypothetical protein ACTSVB_04670 [Candidatus Heimdallarchaeaceae archaeon]
MAKINKYLQQTDDKLIAAQPCKVTIEMTDYTMSDTLQIKQEDGIIWVKSLISKVEFSDIVFNMMLDYPVELQTPNIELVGKERIILTYLKEDIILTIPFTTVEIKEQVNYIKRLLGGREMYKDPSHLLKKILKVYGGGISDLDLVYMEIMASQVLRDKKDHGIPARLGRKWDPVMANIKTDVFSTSFIQGLEFENVGKAIDTGLTTSRETEPSILEKIVTGELVAPKRRKR